MTVSPSDRIGGTVGNVLLVLASLAVLAAVIYPPAADRAFTARVDAAAEGVERLRTVVGQIREETGTWPPTSPVASLASELVDADGEASSANGGTRFSWRRLEAVEVPEPSTELADSVPEALDDAGQELPAPEPSFYHRGAISVRSPDLSLLAALVDRYPGSFVHDGVWTLPLPRVPAP